MPPSTQKPHNKTPKFFPPAKTSMHREKSRAETIMFRCTNAFFPSASKNEEIISWKVWTWCEMRQIIRSDKMMFDNIEHVSQ
jgi:hypothetical protein